MIIKVFATLIVVIVFASCNMLKTTEGHNSKRSELSTDEISKALGMNYVDILIDEKYKGKMMGVAYKTENDVIENGCVTVMETGVSRLIYYEIDGVLKFSMTNGKSHFTSCISLSALQKYSRMKIPIGNNNDIYEHNQVFAKWSSNESISNSAVVKNGEIGFFIKISDK